MQVKLILIAVMGLMPFLFSCSKTSTETLDEMVNVEAVPKMSGSFKGYGSENVSGTAKIFVTNTQYMLKLENFSTTNGPDLKVIFLKQPHLPIIFR